MGGASLYSKLELGGASSPYPILDVNGAYIKLYTIYMYKTE